MARSDSSNRYASSQGIYLFLIFVLKWAVDFQIEFLFVFQAESLIA
jgi:hypothetical protein